MNRIFKLNAVLLILALLSSCSEKTVYETNIDQPNQAWNTLKPAVFDFNIQDTSKTYKVCLALKLNHNMQERLIPIDIQMIYPNSESRSDLQYLFVDSAAHVGDYSVFTLQANKHFNNPGKYHYSILQRTSKYDLAGVESIGIRVKITKPKKVEEETD
jgi:gliding motility-associated lipoprotein GldH